MDYLQELDRELALTKELMLAADSLSSQARCGVRRELAANHIAEASTNVLNEQLRSGGGLSREWTKTVINLAIAKSMEAEPHYQPNAISIDTIKTTTSGGIFRSPMIELAIWLDNPERKTQGKILLTKEMARDVANQLLTLIASLET